MTEFDYDSLDEGIREKVRSLQKAGFNTIDSGDGSKWDWMSCASMPHAHIVCRMDALGTMSHCMDASQVGLDILGDGWTAEISYTYGEDSAIIVFQLPDENSHDKQMSRLQAGFHAEYRERLAIEHGPAIVDRHRATLAECRKGYYPHVIDKAVEKYGTQIAKTEDLELIQRFWNEVWQLLPDNPSIQRPPFHVICDLAVMEELA